MSNNLKATELRIGNYIEINAHIENKLIRVNTYHIGQLLISEKSYLPITLTEEWLDRLGFYSKYKSNHKMWNIFGFNLHQISDEDENGNKIPQEQIFYYGFSYEIKYVHQLQNLYFALTGEELTIKEQ